MKKSALTAIICLSASFAIAAPDGTEGETATAEQTERAETILTKLDTDQSGDLSLEEWKASPKKKDAAKNTEVFTELDTDESGTLSKEELEAMPPKKGKKGKKDKKGKKGKGGDEKKPEGE